MSYSWKTALDTAMEKNAHDLSHRFLQLATQGDDGFPANRTVVFRGFSEAGELMIVTDQRSAKAGQLARSNKVEACWYFTGTREQFRFRGEVQVVDESASRASERAAAWDRLSEAAREQFFWPPPGMPVSQAGTADLSGSPPPAFLLVLLSPQQVDHLHLATSPQERVVSSLVEGEWQSTPVNP